MFFWSTQVAVNLRANQGPLNHSTSLLSCSPFISPLQLAK